MATKSPEATIDFLLTCMECTEGKPDWEQVATKTGWYKAGKFSRQAFTTIQKKYAGTEIGGANTSAAKVTTKGGEKAKKTATKTTKKRAAEYDVKEKKTTTKTTKKRAAEADVKEKKGPAKKAKKEQTPATVDDEAEGDEGSGDDEVERDGGSGDGSVDGDNE